MSVLFCLLNKLCLLFSIIGKLHRAIVDFGVALGQHVNALSGGTEAFAKVSTEMLFQFFFAHATNSCSRQHALELCCGHWFADGYSLAFTGGKEGVVVVADDVVRDAICRFKCATLFRAGDLDGGVDPFFQVEEGMIAFCLWNSNVK